MTKNNNPLHHGTSQFLRWLANGGRESLNMNDMLEEEKEGGDGGDRESDAVEFEELDPMLLDALLGDRLECLAKNGGPEADNCEINGILLKKGLALEVSMPSIPADWMPTTVKTEKGEPAFENINNTGKWPKFAN